MKNNKLKNISLILAIISLSILLVVIPATVEINKSNLGLWTSYMHKDKNLIEKDFYKSNKFEFDMLRPISYWLGESVTNIDNAVDKYIAEYTTYEWVTEKNEDGKKVRYNKEIKPTIEEAKRVIERKINNSKEQLDNYKNMKFMVINTEDNSYYTNTEYKILAEYKKNIDDYLDIEIHKTQTDRVYIKDINNKLEKNSDQVRNKLLDAIESENIEIYISLPNPKDFNYNDEIYYYYDSHKSVVKVAEILVFMLILNLVVFIVSTLIYKKLKKNSLNEESQVFKFIKKVPLEFWLIFISIGTFFYFIFSYGSYFYFYNINNNYQYVRDCLIAFIPNLIYVSILYLSIRIIFSFDNKLDVLKYTIVYRVYKLLKQIYKILLKQIHKISKENIKVIKNSSKKIPLIKRIVLIGVTLAIGGLAFGFILSMLFGNPYPVIIMPYIAVLVFIWYIVKRLSYLSEIIDGTEKIKNGEINHKIETKGYDNFTVLAENINNIGEGLEKSIDTQLRSERMKSELITNVSHDLKTPLTSIINYIELIKKEDNIQPEHIKDYINVLDSKSNRLKALIEDLFEASKASSGNIELNMERIDIKQLLRQSIGEIEEKLSKSNLDLKINMPEDKVYIYADGRRMYRVFENLLSNIAKYSLSNTRVYIDLVENDENIRLTMKNISSYELNFDANEITERFKRADESRNTEGSGLGLAISKDLVKIQGGTFEIEIDGDLFKSSIEFKKLVD